MNINQSPEAACNTTYDVAPIQAPQTAKDRRRQASKSHSPLACPLYKHDPLRYGGPRGCADWCTLEIHRLFSDHLKMHVHRGHISQGTLDGAKRLPAKFGSLSPQQRIESRWQAAYLHLHNLARDHAIPSPYYNRRDLNALEDTGQSQTEDIPAPPIFQPQTTTEPRSAQPGPLYEAFYDVPEDSMQIRTESITTSSVLQSQTTPQPPSAHSQPRYELVIGDFFAPAPTLFDPLHALSTNQFDDDIASFPRDSASRMLPSSSLPVPGSACDDCGKMPSAEIDVDVECRRGLPPLLTFNFHFLKSGLSFSEERLRMQLFRMDRRVSNHPWATKGHTSLSLKSIVQEIMEDEARLRHIPLRLSRAPEEMDLWTVKLKVSPKYKYGVEVVACGRSS